jgi:enamine deaminase RidA (YjgF/YER057c/UK114 family)
MTDVPHSTPDRIQVVAVPGFPPPKGYANGIVASGRRLYVAGQVGWDEREVIVSDDVGEQFVKALDNVLAVVRAAGGRPEDVVKMTVFVTDVDGYVAARALLRTAWRERFGRHYPAMALIGIARLFEPGAKVEIEAVAELADR